MALSSLCSVPDCEKPTFMGQYCAMHRTRLMRHGSVELPPRKSRRVGLSELLGGIFVFGDLTVIGERDGEHVPGQGAPRLLLCRCVCGNEKLFPVGNVKRGLSKSCGCTRAKRVADSKLRHGQNRKGATTAEYRCWAHIIGRCENPNDNAFGNYGGRGIIVCKRWRDSFEAFFEDMGPRPSPKHSIDRIDVNGNYEPGNCRWAIKFEQDRNKRTNRWVEYQGERLCIKDMAAKHGIERRTLGDRLKRGWSVERAITTPV